MGGIGGAELVIGLAVVLVAVTVFYLYRGRVVRISTEVPLISDDLDRIESVLFRTLSRLRGIEVTSPAYGLFTLRRPGSSVVPYVIVSVIAFPLGLLAWLFYRRASVLNVVLVRERRVIRCSGDLPENDWREVKDLAVLAAGLGTPVVTD